LEHTIEETVRNLRELRIERWVPFGDLGSVELKVGVQLVELTVEVTQYLRRIRLLEHVASDCLDGIDAIEKSARRCIE
jgi:hypothetical protein